MDTRPTSSSAGSGRRKVVLTHWDPQVYEALPAEVILIQLIAASMRYKEVLIPDQHIAVNRPLAKALLRNPHWFDLLEEICSTGGVRINTQRPENYPDNELGEKSRKQPIRARALHVKRQSSYQGRPFDPDTEPFLTFHKKLDELLDRNSVARREQAWSAQIPQLFAKEFLEACHICASTQSANDFDFSSPGLLVEFSELAADPEKAAASIRDEGKKIIGSIESPRSRVYQLAQTKKFGAIEGEVRKLAQSVFAAVYSDAERAEGVFTPFLPEPPLRETSDEEPPGLWTPLGTRKIGKIVLCKGVGTVIAAVRSRIANEETVDDAKLVEAWTASLDGFAAANPKSPRAMVACIEKLATSVGFAAACFGIVLSSLAPGANVVGTAASIMGGLVMFGSTVSRLWRSAKTRDRVRAALKDMDRYRYHRIPLLTGPPPEAETASKEQGKQGPA